VIERDAAVGRLAEFEGRAWRAERLARAGACAAPPGPALTLRLARVGASWPFRPCRAYTPAMCRIIRRLKQLRFHPFDRGDYSMDGERRLENTDALGAARGNQSPQGGSVPSGYPPGYVPPADEGRPRH